MRRAAAVVVLAAAVMATMPGGASAEPAADDIPGHFVGVSIEWTLIDRYMGPNARPGFAKLLRNLGSGVLRIGGSSQDQVPFDATAPDSDRFVTPQDLASIRATLDLVDSERVADAGLGDGAGHRAGTVHARPSRGAASTTRARSSATVSRRSSETTRAGGEVAGIALGNEPDLTYSGDLARYLSDSRPTPAPSTSTSGRAWCPRRARTSGPGRASGTARSTPGGSGTGPRSSTASRPRSRTRSGVLGPFATDHFYPLARTCASDPYRCPSIERLLSQERMDNFDYEVYTHAAEAARRGLRYRMDETNTAAGRGAPGVSDVAASGTWTLDTLFHAACPQPPDQPGANADCHLGATGVNVHNAEVRAYFFPQEGNAYYNAIRYDPTPAAGTPTAGAVVLRAAAVRPARPRDHRAAPRHPDVPRRRVCRSAAWEVRTARSERRVFLINKGRRRSRSTCRRPALGEIDRMTPYDPTGAGRTLDAPEMRIDGRAVAADGDVPRPRSRPLPRPHDGRLPVTLAPGEAVVITLHDYAETERDRPVRAARCRRPCRCRSGRRRRSATFTPGVDRSYETGDDGDGDLDRGRRDPGGGRSERHGDRPARQRLVRPRRAAAGPGQVRVLRAVEHDAARRCSLTYSAPVSNDAVAIAFRQHIGATDALRTGDLLQDPDVHAVDDDAVANRPTSGRRRGSSKRDPHPEGPDAVHRPVPGRRLAAAPNRPRRQRVPPPQRRRRGPQTAASGIRGARPSRRGRPRRPAARSPDRRRDAVPRARPLRGPGLRRRLLSRPRRALQRLRARRRRTAGRARAPRLADRRRGAAVRRRHPRRRRPLDAALRP